MGRFRPFMLIVTLLLSGSFVTARARCLQVWLTRVRRSRGTCKFPEKYQSSMQRCTKLAKQKDLENFEIFLQIARDGSVQKILVSPNAEHRLKGLKGEPTSGVLDSASRAKSFSLLTAVSIPEFSLCSLLPRLRGSCLSSGRG